jgi:hypothetical protein
MFFFVFSQNRRLDEGSLRWRGQNTCWARRWAPRSGVPGTEALSRVSSRRSSQVSPTDWARRECCSERTYASPNNDTPALPRPPFAWPGRHSRWLKAAAAFVSLSAGIFLLCTLWSSARGLGGRDASAIRCVVAARRIFSAGQGYSARHIGGACLRDAAGRLRGLT